MLVKNLCRTCEAVFKDETVLIRIGNATVITSPKLACRPCPSSEASLECSTVILLLSENLAWYPKHLF